MFLRARRRKQEPPPLLPEMIEMKHRVPNRNVESIASVLALFGGNTRLAEEHLLLDYPAPCKLNMKKSRIKRKLLSAASTKNAWNFIDSQGKLRVPPERLFEMKAEDGHPIPTSAMESSGEEVRVTFRDQYVQHDEIAIENTTPSSEDATSEAKTPPEAHLISGRAPPVDMATEAPLRKVAKAESSDHREPTAADDTDVQKKHNSSLRRSLNKLQTQFADIQAEVLRLRIIHREALRHRDKATNVLAAVKPEQPQPRSTQEEVASTPNDQQDADPTESLITQLIFIALSVILFPLVVIYCFIGGEVNQDSDNSLQLADSPRPSTLQPREAEVLHTFSSLPPDPKVTSIAKDVNLS